MFSMFLAAAAIAAQTSSSEHACVFDSVGKRMLVSSVVLREHEANGRKWYIANSPILRGKTRYIKYGLPRNLSENLDALPFLLLKDNVPILAEKGQGLSPDVLYVFARSDDCEFQPYQKVAAPTKKARKRK